MQALLLDRRGVAGDRTHALTQPAWADRLLTARQAHGLLDWSAAYDEPVGDPERPPAPLLTTPAGRRVRWSDPRLPGLLQADLGLDEPPALRRDPAGQQDLAGTVLVTTAASLAALGDELGAPIDLRRFRPNLHLELDAPAFAELGWQGGRLRVGEAELELLHPCTRCVIPTLDPETGARWPELLRHLARGHDTLFGINARPIRLATVRAGDPVTAGHAPSVA